MSAWILAFTATSVIEVPIHARALAALDGRARRVAVAFAASALTHPFVYLVFPRLLGSGLVYLLVAEAFAVLVEAWWLRRFGVRDALLWSLVANASSVAVASAFRVLQTFAG
ncbi:hypothetical protein G6O69_19955 [Pseudenhygromyxa sp. WMMC2535]|uniref:hypothetical protein n=1 Tax=Pseudenhygromyxa sp. WMMC2535 TaxID=2712867 RepID=UPI001552EF8A|nr:hypothetical protein [Pseudenhygromyxa sp. WMMC2535]NVB40131.1 hypothetical protein [Pseudenhygromyxa sp. WMMC2535]